MLLSITVWSQPSSAKDILDITVEQMTFTEAWWDKLWKKTFDPTDPAANISIYSFTHIVRFILGIGLIFWIFDYGKKMVNSRGVSHNLQIFGESFLPVVLILLFLANQGLYSRVLAYGLRDIINSWTNGVLEAQITGRSFRQAMEEQLLLEETKNEIRNQAEKCIQMPRPDVTVPSRERPELDPQNPLTVEQEQVYDYFDCIKKLQTFIERKQQEAQNSRGCLGGCGFFVGFMKAMRTAAYNIFTNEADKRVSDAQRLNSEEAAFREQYQEMADFIKSLPNKTWIYMFAASQWFAIAFLEGSMWLLGLFAPLFLALAIIPGKQNMFYFWLIEYMTIGLAKVAYVVVVGITAIQSTEPTQALFLTQDQRFFFALSIFAPGVSFAIVTAGGIAAASSFRSQSVGSANVLVNAATGSMLSITHAIVRHSDKNR